MSKLKSISKYLLVGFFTLPLILFFTNCSGQFSIEEGATSSLASLSSSNGGGSGDTNGGGAGIPIAGGAFKWTTVTPSSDTKTVYLSSSQGSDSNDCLSEANPCKTQAQAISLLRNGFPDHLLIKRGDTFIGSLSQKWALSGRSDAEPILVAAYGDSGDRPYFRTDLATGFSLDMSGPVNNVHLMDLHFHANQRDPRDPSFNTNYASWITAGAATGYMILTNYNIGNFLVENCEFEYFSTNVIIQTTAPSTLAGHTSGPKISNIRFRANNFHDSWTLRGSRYNEGHTQGMFAAHINGLLLEQNVFDHNAGLLNYPNDPRGIIPPGLLANEVAGDYFSRQLYSLENSNVVLIGNIFANGDCVQIRSGGTVINNLFVRCIVALNGGATDKEFSTEGYVFNVQNNLFMEGTDFPMESKTPVEGGRGIFLFHSKAGVQSQVTKNLFLRDISRTNGGVGIVIDGTRENGGIPLHIRNMLVANNELINWRGGISTLGAPGQQIMNTQVQNNRIYSPQDIETALGIISGAGGSSVVWSGNDYTSGITNGKLFSNATGGRLSFIEWSALAGEIGSTIAKTSVANPNVKFEEVVAGVGSSYENAWVQLRKRNRWNWNGNLEAENLISKIRSDVGVTP